eukprot:TRINITY_DN2188_c0_g1_i1.p1 TRINITY_DN2188_c0_g1~~TRINITY_DN2188_c0_g1_i1.p1  ORF type:complete len:761 (+),score=143.66 TRINITY_DN2188_c0_g1_i1:19-2301(+)
MAKTLDLTVGDLVKALPGASFKDVYTEGDEGVVTEVDDELYTIIWYKTHKVSTMKKEAWLQYFDRVGHSDIILKIGDLVKAWPGISFEDFYKEGDEGVVTEVGDELYTIIWYKTHKVSTMKKGSWLASFDRVGHSDIILKIGDLVKAWPGACFKDFYGEGDEGVVTGVDDEDYSITWYKTRKTSTMAKDWWLKWFYRMGHTNVALNIGDMVKARPGTIFELLYIEGDEGVVTEEQDKRYSIQWFRTGKVSTFPVNSWLEKFDHIGQARNDFEVGDRIEVLYEGEWFIGTVLKLPQDDEDKKNRWTVQCDVDDTGVRTFSKTIRSPIEDRQIDHVASDDVFYDIHGFPFKVGQKVKARAKTECLASCVPDGIMTVTVADKSAVTFQWSGRIWSRGRPKLSTYFNLEILAGGQQEEHDLEDPQGDSLSKVSISAASLRMLDADMESGAGDIRVPLLGLDQTPVLTPEEAGAQCGSLVVDLMTMLTVCKSVIQKRQRKGEILSHVPEAGACVLALYSAAWPNPCDSFYHVLNTSLRAIDRTGVKPFYAMLRLMREAMKVIKPYIGAVWRGVKGNLTSKYPEGEQIIWWAFSSCTTKVDVLENEMFLGQEGDRTLFMIENAVGFDIRPFSFYQHESEVLLPAGSEMRVKSKVHAGSGLNIINLQMVPTTHCIIDLNSYISGSVSSVVQINQGCPVEGLMAILEQAKINPATANKIMDWCREQEAAELEELIEVFDDLAAACDISALPKKRLLAALTAFQKALGE